MKKIVLSSILAMGLLSTTATAETKVGLGFDVAGGNQILRVSVDGLATGLRVEPRFMIATDSSAAATPVKGAISAYGIGAYYDLAAGLSVGGFFDMQGAYTMDDVEVSSDITRLGLALKAEAAIGKSLSIAFEAGIQNITSTAYTVPGTADAESSSDLDTYSAITMRLFF